MSNKQAVPQQVYGNQVQLTLVTWCLLKFRAAKSISYEIDDDISVWLNDGTKLFIQVKSGKSNPFLDSSLDIWKSILNWTNRCTEGNSEKFIFTKKLFNFKKTIISIRYIDHCTALTKKRAMQK